MVSDGAGMRLLLLQCVMMSGELADFFNVSVADLDLDQRPPWSVSNGSVSDGWNGDDRSETTRLRDGIRSSRLLSET